jgi:hypothetical protein
LVSSSPSTQPFSPASPLPSSLPSTQPYSAHTAPLPSSSRSFNLPPPTFLIASDNCDRMCPLCTKTFGGKVKDAKKALAMHVNAVHASDPENIRLQTWR